MIISKSYLTIVFAFVSSIGWSQVLDKKKLEGAWESTDTQGNISSLIVSNGFYSVAEYSQTSFLLTYGGRWDVQNGEFIAQIEFNSASPSLVGKKSATTISISPSGSLSLNEKNWERIDDNTPGDLPGGWIITGRMRDGEMTERKPGPRKTMKILSGTRFQWIAYHTETGQFMGTGGGLYTTENGNYSEEIEFFSRDQLRVGAVLGFKYELIDGQWHHQGKSSKGADIYEIWSLR